jgi:O-succinylbenzoate synthase
MMKLEQITLYHLQMPLVAPFATSFGSIDTRECILLEVKADGIIGWGECVADRDPGYAYETVGTAWHILSDFLIPPLFGQEIIDATDLQNHMAHVKGHQMAKAGIEMAIWDLMGKLQGCSVRELLGGNRIKVHVGVSIGIQQNPSQLLSVVENYLKLGYQRVKIKIKPGRDVADTKAVRDSFPDLRLQVDANSAYILEDADALKPLDEMDLLLIEQPLAEDDLWDHHRLQAQFKTPLCLDESITSLRHARQALEMKSCRVINIKQGRVGGLSQAVAIHDFCQNQNIPVWCGGMLETGLGRAANLALASLPNFLLPGDISATDRYYLRDITQERFVLNTDSTIDVPAGAGLGVNIDRHALEKFTLAQKELSFGS